MMRHDLTPSELTTIIQSAIRPLSEKVDDLLVNRVTRSDIEALRAEIKASYVPRDAYEPRHTALVDRDLQLESMLRELRKDTDADLQKFEIRMKEQGQTQLSAKDRGWLRASQAVSVLVVIITIIDFLSQHHFTF